jgi:Protein of unknown function (DUF2924)
MQDKGLSKSPQTISRKLASLESSPIKVLKQQWLALYGSEAPHRVSRELLTRAVAYRIQEQARGGLKPSTPRLLVRLGNDARDGQPLKFEPATAVSAGTVLVRDRSIDRKRPLEFFPVPVSGPRARGHRSGPALLRALE